MPNTGSLYVLYHPSDVFLALTLATDLKNYGVTIWLDRLQLDEQDDAFELSRDAEDNCSAVLALISPDLLASGYGRAVIETSHTLAKPIIAVQVRRVDVSIIPPQLDAQQFIQLLNWQNAQSYRAAREHLLKTLRELGVVAISGFVNPEKRQTHHLVATIQAQKALLEQNRHTVYTDNFLPLPIEVEKNWGLNGVFLARGVLLQEARPQSNLQRFSAENPRFIIIGKRGVGKSTTMLRLLWEYLQDKPNNKHIPMPFYIDLRAWDADIDFEEFLKRSIEFPSIFQSVFDGQAIVFLDHLDQMAAYSVERVQQVKAWLFNTDAFPRRVILACNSDVYTPEHWLNLPVLQIESSLQARLDSVPSTTLLPEDLNAFKIAVSEDPIWRWHGANASHFFVLLASYLHHKSISVKSPERLHLEFIQMLWQREQILGNPDWMPFEELLPALSEFAYVMLSKQLATSLPRDEIARYLGNDYIVDALASASIFIIERERYTFAKPYYREVLAALHLQTQPLYTHLASPIRVGEGWKSGVWEDVVVALFGLADDIDSLLTAVADVNPVLAVTCLYGRNPLLQHKRYVSTKLLGYAKEYPDNAPLIVAQFETLFDGEPYKGLYPLMRLGALSARWYATEFLLYARYPVAPDIERAFESWQGERNRQVSQLLAELGDELLPSLLRLLRYGNAEQRANAAWALGEIADSAAVAALLSALEDSDARVRHDAVVSLGRIEDIDSVESLVQCLKDPVPKVREAVTIALTRIGTSSIPSLLRMLQSDNDNAKRIAIGVLGQVGDASVLKNVEPFLADKNPDLRAIAILSMGYLRAEALVPQIATFLADTTKPQWGSKNIAELAEQSLKLIGTTEASMHLQRHRPSAQTARERLKEDKQELKDSNSAMVVPSSSTFLPPAQEGTIVEKTPILTPDTDDTDNVLLLLHQLTTGMWVDRERAARALRAYGEMWRGSQNPEHVERLLPYLNNKDSYVRWAVVEALAWVRNRAVVTYLLPLLKDSVWTVRVATVEALAQIGDSIAITYLQECVSDAHEKVREMVVIALGTFRGEDILSPLVDCLEDNASIVRLTAVETLGNLGDKRATQFLIPLLADEDVVMRWAVVEALGKLRDELAVPHLSPLLDDDAYLPWEEESPMTIAHLTAQVLAIIGSQSAQHAVKQWKKQAGIG